MDLIANKAFAEQAAREGVPIGAVVVACRNRGMPHALAVQMAEESAAEAYLRSLGARFADYTHYRRWLMRTALNWVVDQLRKRRSLRPLPADEGLMAAACPPEEEGAMLRAFAARLPPDEREILRLA